MLYNYVKKPVNILGHDAYQIIVAEKCFSGI